MTEPRDLFQEWRSAMEGLISSIASAAGLTDARQLLGPLQRQSELLQQALERQQGLQRQVMDRAFQPLDAVFDLVERSGAMFREQAEALHQASQAVQRTAELMLRQAEMFEAATRAARRPADVLRSASGASPREAP